MNNLQQNPMTSTSDLSVAPIWQSSAVVHVQAVLTSVLKQLLIVIPDIKMQPRARIIVLRPFAACFPNKLQHGSWNWQSCWLTTLLPIGSGSKGFLGKWVFRPLWSPTHRRVQRNDLAFNWCFRKSIRSMPFNFRVKTNLHALRVRSHSPHAGGTTWHQPSMLFCMGSGMEPHWLVGFT